MNSYFWLDHQNYTNLEEFPNITSLYFNDFFKHFLNLNEYYLIHFNNVHSNVFSRQIYIKAMKSYTYLETTES
jgi:hypothetical protein